MGVSFFDDVVHAKLISGAIGSARRWQLARLGSTGREPADRVTYAHTSAIQQAAPLKGRNIPVGLRMDFQADRPRLSAAKRRSSNCAANAGGG